MHQIIEVKTIKRQLLIAIHTFNPTPLFMMGCYYVHLPISSFKERMKILTFFYHLKICDCVLL